MEGQNFNFTNIFRSKIIESPNSRKPEDIVRNLLNYKRSGQVLDVGAGNGNNAIFLAENGFNVSAVDSNIDKIKELEKTAKNAGPNIISKIKTEVRDATKGIEGTFDIILSNKMLNFLSRDQALNLIEDIKKHTKKGGMNVISAVMNEGDFWNQAQREKEEGVFNPNTDCFYASTNEIFSLYKDWEILEYKEEWKKYEIFYNDNPDAQNKTALLTAKKIKD